MRFVVFGDSKGKNNGINKKVLHSLMKSCSKLNPEPEFIVVCGDSVAGSKYEEVLYKQLCDFKGIIEKYHGKKTIFPVVGNHEVNIAPQDDRYEKILNAFYNSVIPDINCLDEYNKSVYYMDFNNTRLIMLNSFHCGEIHKISREQLNWLEQITNNCSKNKLLFVHSPAFPTGAHYGHCLDLYPHYRDRFWNTVEKCNINIVFCGHEHNYSRRLIKTSYNPKGIYQIITGGGGEKLRNKYVSKEGVVVAPIALYHYLIVDIDYSSINICAITPKGKILDKFSIDI